MTRLEFSLPYVAGFFDGEGSIGIYRNGRGNGCTLHVQITQTVGPQADELLRAIQARWGGSLTPMNKKLRRPAWNYQASASAGVALLRDLRPYLLLKADQADVALAWWDAREKPRRGADGRRMPMSPEGRAHDQRASETLKAMKVSA